MKKGWILSLFILPIQLLCSGVALPQSSRFVGDYSNAQQFMQDISGKPVYLRVEYNVEGTPFYPDEYYRANIYLKYGRVYTGIFVKFNLLENLVLFKSPDGAEMSATTAIKRIIFTDTSNNWIMYNTIFESGFPSIDKQNENTFYEVLDSGKTKLLKYHSVSFSDKKYYGQASITRIFDQKENYYICFPDGAMRKIEKGKDDFLSLFADKKAELSKYINQQKLKCRKENDWKKIIAYYNSLFSNP